MSHRDKTLRICDWFVKIEDFRTALSIPKSYQMSNIDVQIFNQAEKEVTTPDEYGKVIFSKVKVEKVKSRKGNKIQSFRIYFKEPKLDQVPLNNWLENK